MNRVILMDDFKTMITLKKWQEKFNLKPFELSKHLNLTYDNIECQGELVLSEVLIDIFERIRDKFGKPIKINSGYRTQAKQDELNKAGYKTAKVSPHCRGYALDLGFIPTEGENLLSACRYVRNEFDGMIRLGWKQYWAENMKFVHIDVCPIANMNIVHNDFPEAWKIKYMEF